MDLYSRHFIDYFKIFFTPDHPNFLVKKNFAKWEVNIDNTVLNACYIASKLEGNIHSFLEEHCPKNLAHSWYINDFKQGKEIGNCLLEKGYALLGSFRYLEGTLTKELPILKQFEIVEVSSPEELKDFARILCTVFTPGKSETFDAYYKHYQKPKLPIHNYLVYLDKQAVACASLLLTHGVDSQPEFAGLWNAAVLEKYRRKGIGEALAIHRYNAAIKLGFRKIGKILTPESKAWPYCKKLGFKDHHQLYAYSLM